MGLPGGRAMDEDEIRVRAAVPSDAYALWLWANDPETRGASFTGAEIPWADHVRWLADRLTDGSSVVLVGEDESRPVGLVRFESKDGWRTARLSYVVAPEARGEGWGSRLVQRGLTHLKRIYPEVAVWAEVKPANERSLRVFRGLGWTEERAAGDATTFWWGRAGGAR
jgi:UDP-2,4-diacetamido-2,4,6-trideoxy-beta-L-altropyranose hydrolase